MWLGPLEGYRPCAGGSLGAWGGEGQLQLFRQLQISSDNQLASAALCSAGPTEKLAGVGAAWETEGPTDRGARGYHTGREEGGGTVGGPGVPAGGPMEGGPGPSPQAAFVGPCQPLPAVGPPPSHGPPSLSKPPQWRSPQQAQGPERGGALGHPSLCTRTHTRAHTPLPCTLRRLPGIWALCATQWTPCLCPFPGWARGAPPSSPPPSLLCPRSGLPGPLSS